MSEIQRRVLRTAHTARQQYWRIAKPNTFGVKVAAFCPETERFLLVRHSYDGVDKYTFPGGGYRPKRETPEEAAARELRQETGLHLGGAVIIGSYETDLEGKHDTVSVVRGDVAGEQMTTNAEIRDSLWVDLEQMQIVELTKAGTLIRGYLRSGL